MSTPTRFAIACAALAASCASHALSFNYRFFGDGSADQRQAIVAAGAEWSSVIETDVTVNLTFDFGHQLRYNNVYAQTTSFYSQMDYADYRNSLAGVSSSAADAKAVVSLPATANFDRLINRTVDNPAGAGSASPYVDHGGKVIEVTAANARALGHAPTGTLAACYGNCDAYIEINSVYNYGSGAFDTNPSDGIEPGRLDFVGIMTHEIGHALGFASGVDGLDYYARYAPGNTKASDFNAQALDLFRYSNLSAASHAADFTADQRPKYFSVDGGATLGAEFSEGLYYGDGAQASHWKNSPDALGVMAPYLQRGVLAPRISAADLLAMDAIGWTVSAVPEPATVTLFLSGLAGLAGARARRRSRERSMAC